jgi:hypothetical protein
MSRKHSWRFFRAGGFDQVRLERGSDLLALDQLDQKLWVALACPVGGIDFDRKTLEMLDRDGDGRVRANDLIEQVRWLRLVLADPDELVRDGEELRLSAIDYTTPEGARVLASAKRILTNLGRPDGEAILLADTLDTEHIFAATHFNGDGVVPAAAAEDEAIGALIEDIIACMGGETDRSGAPGVTQARIDDFYTAIGQQAAWLDHEPRPLAERSAAATAALIAVRDKVDGFFLRCRLAAYSPDAAEAVNPASALFAAMADKDLADSMALLDPLPLAAVTAEGTLPLGAGLNPAWADRMAAFKREVVVPLLGERDTLSAENWAIVLDRFAERLDWVKDRPETPLAPLTDQRVLDIRAMDAKARLDHLVVQDKALEGEAAAIDEVVRLIRLRLNLHRLCNNFVSFREFYARKAKAVFQAGTLFLDGRSADLCVRVDDPARHATLATLARIYLVYCDCFRRASGEKITIAAAFTAGDSDQLMVGRNGVFYDRDGRDWDATIVKLVEHPISMRQAFWSPYKQLAKLIHDQIEKTAAARAAQPPVQVVQVTAPAAAPKPAAPPPAAAAAAAPPAFDVGRFAGVFAAIGLALGAIGTAVASVVTGFLKLVWWQMPLALMGLLLVVSGPSMVIAYMKLRQRNLAPILDATGWAVNARARINIPFGGSLTAVARLPEGAERSLVDPYAEKTTPWGLYATLAVVAAALVAAWRFGLVARLLAM